jgi:Tol biopolymer transport system component
VALKVSLPAGIDIVDAGDLRGEMIWSGTISHNLESITDGGLGSRGADMLSCRMKIAACAGLVAAAFLFSSVALTTKSLGETASGQIAFVREGARHGIYTIDPSTAIVTRLTNGEDYRPRWSPDGTQIVFQRFISSAESLQTDLFLVNVDGSGLQRLTELGTAFQPAWSPDGSKIVFGSGHGRASEIFVMNADGTDQIRLTHDRFADTVPAWSPDGTTIAFASGRHHNVDIYLMASDGSHVRRLTHVRARDENPDWSPDGSRLVFQSNRGNPRYDLDLYSISPSGSGIERLTSSTATEWAPAWSPGGTQIAFTTARYPKGVEDIAVLALWSPVIVRFVIPGSLELEPDWQPA